MLFDEDDHLLAERVVVWYRYIQEACRSALSDGKQELLTWRNKHNVIRDFEIISEEWVAACAASITKCIGIIDSKLSIFKERMSSLK